MRQGQKKKNKKMKLITVAEWNFFPNFQIFKRYKTRLQNLENSIFFWIELYRTAHIYIYTHFLNLYIFGYVTRFLNVNSNASWQVLRKYSVKQRYNHPQKEKVSKIVNAVLLYGSAGVIWPTTSTSNFLNRLLGGSCWRLKIE